MSAVLAFLGGLLKSLLLPIVAYMKGRDDVESENLKDQNTKLRNRPRTSTDINKLFKELIIKSKDSE